MKSKPSRMMSLELLRVISMCMIIVLHFFTYSNAFENIDAFTTKFFLKEIVRSLCNVSVNCYILISGYFCINSKFKLNKLISLLLEVLFYSLSIALVFMATGRAHPTAKDFFFICLPTLTRRYWFVTTYVGVYCLTPIIREVIAGISQKIHMMILITGFVLFVLYYNLFFFCDNLNFGGATGVVWFIYLYFCGAYIKKYHKKVSAKKNLLKWGCCALIGILSRAPFYALYFVTSKKFFIDGASVFDSVYNSVFTFLSSIFLFILFADMEIFPGKIRNRIITLLLGVSFVFYYFHKNPYMRDFLWKSLDFSHYTTLQLIWMCISVPVLIYFAVLITDLIRQLLFRFTVENRYFVRLVVRIQEIIAAKTNQIYIKMRG